MLFNLNTVTVMRDGVEHPMGGASRKEAKLEELSNNISERRGVPSR